MLAVVAGRTKRHRLNQRPTTENVQDLPNDAAGVEKIARHGLAFRTDGPFLDSRVIIEVEE